MIKWEKIPRFEIIGDDDMWNTFKCVSDGKAFFNDIEIVFEIGWKTDIASVPWWGRSFLAQIGPHSPAALIHDKLLEMGVERDLARRAMEEQLKMSPKVIKIHRKLMIWGVAFYDLWSKIVP